MSFPGTGSDEQDKIYINVGGKRHESYLSTLRNIPDTRLAWMAEGMINQQSKEPSRKELFFDRHPDLFAVILNYYRTGKLHAPRDVCGPLFQDELNFWGIEEKEMEACCWPNYTQHREAEKNLKDFVGPEFEDEEVEDDASNERDNSCGGGEQGRLSLWQQYQPRIWSVLDDAFSSARAKVFALVSLFMILISVLLMCAASLPDIRNYPSRKDAFNKVEYFFCAWFTLEFALRLILCPSKLQFLRQLMTWIDVISLIPYYRKIIFNKNDFDFLRAIRLIRLFRAFRFFKFTSGLQIIVQSLKASFRELLLLVIILLIPVVLFSSIVYEMEKANQPKKFDSIPQTFWWAVITMTTVGYGDMAPETPLGQMIGSICAICGVLIIGLPVSVIGNNFSTYYEHAQARLSLPKKKRRLIMGDVNRLALMQNHSHSSEDRITPDINPIDINDNEDDQEISRNYRRYHRRSRNTIFARGDVYIGQIKPKPPEFETQTEDHESADDVERGESIDDELKPRNFALINSTHESDEVIDELRQTYRNTDDGKCRDKHSFPIPPRSFSPRPSSARSFRSRVSPTPEECDGSNAKLSTRSNTSVTLPPLTVTHLTTPDSPQDEAKGFHKNGTRKEKFLIDKHGDIYHRPENGRPKKTLNGDVPYDS